jgi:hypothetical protein
MTSERSYKITLSNNQTEKRAIDFLMQKDPSFLLPTKEGRKRLLEILGLSKKYARAFDLFKLPGHVNSEHEVTPEHAKLITLVELKTTEKYLPANPKGFFFGATQNEFDVAQALGEQYKFCFVSLHPDSRSFSMLSLADIESLAINKRVQFQINF